MASLRHGRPTCIRAAFSTTGFRKLQRNARHRLQVPQVQAGMGFLDPFDGHSEDNPGHSYQRAHRSLGHRNCSVPPNTLKSKSPEEVSMADFLSPRVPDLLVKGAGWAPASLDTNDVDMLPEGELKLPMEVHHYPEAEGWNTRPAAWPEDWRTTRPADPLAPVEPSLGARHLPSRTRGTRLSPRLGSERDKGPRLSLSKRKLELLLAEPEKPKRRKYTTYSKGWSKLLLMDVRVFKMKLMTLSAGLK
uniref:Uncharacterized protein n=1 Tax=Castor canadensis TaxID=51338 RepID=A0A8C0WKU2_CASCN